MKNVHIKILLLFFLSARVWIASASAAFADHNSEYHTYLDVKIEMDKTVFKLKEPIEGKVIITNTGPATLLGSFAVKLFKGDVLKFTTTIYIKTIFIGRTDFAFKNFGIPNINDDPEAAGHWRLVIYPANRDEQSGVSQEFVVGD